MFSFSIFVGIKSLSHDLVCSSIMIFFTILSKTGLNMSKLSLTCHSVSWYFLYFSKLSLIFWILSIKNVAEVFSQFIILPGVREGIVNL